MLCEALANLLDYGGLIYDHKSLVGLIMEISELMEVFLAIV